MQDIVHIPVLAKEVLAALAPEPGKSYLDLTAGYGGHANLVLEKLNSNGQAKLVDRDTNAVNYLKQKFAEDSRVIVIKNDYHNALMDFLERNERFDYILADIGVSSPHLDNQDRGFSFMNNGPLDMRMDNTSGQTAAEIVNTFQAESLANLLYKYGELKNSRFLARRIIENRPYSSTTDLAAVIPGQFKVRMRTLAQVFQALRIEVNDELNQLEKSLPIIHKLLNHGGKVAIITFHSLEDRIVKDYFKSHSGHNYDAEFINLSRTPIVPREEEIVNNPRSRSAKLRVMQRK